MKNNLQVLAFWEAELYRRVTLFPTPTDFNSGRLVGAPERYAVVYQQKFVVAVKCGGKVLREIDESVVLPFGAEYSILLKNLNSVRAMAKVSVDGQDATEGWLIVPSNGSIDLERFIRNGNLDKGNRFKFIERTDEIEQHRGARVDDGLVRVEYKFELVPVYTPPPIQWQSDPWWKTQPWGGTYCNSGGLVKSQALNCNCLRSTSTAGITVPGSQSNQKFVTGSWFPTESESHVIVLQLRGEFKGTPIHQPLTVDRKPVCVTCGRINKAISKFCSQCGTALELF